MNNQSAEMDVESLQSSKRRRGAALDAFLVVSVLFLFAAVTALTVAGVWALRQVRSQLEPRPFTGELQSPRAASDTAFTNFAYLEAISSKLENSTMKWAVVQHGNGASLGSSFEFDRDKHSLVPLRPGNYFMYLNLKLTCTYSCNAGLLTVHVGDKLTCEVQLPELADSTPVSRKCWTVSRVEAEQKLMAQMTVPKEGLEHWRLELDSSGLGMFLVD